MKSLSTLKEKLKECDVFNPKISYSENAQKSKINFLSFMISLLFWTIIPAIIITFSYDFDTNKQPKISHSAFRND